MKKIIVALAFTALASNISYAEEKFPIDTKLDGPQGLYTDAMIKLLKTWPGEIQLKDPDFEKSGPVFINVMHTEGRSVYVGVEQRMIINAPLEQVESVVDNIDQYYKMFPSHESTKILSKDGNMWLTSYEQSLPVFFLPNVKFKMTYITDKSSPDRKLYRFQLQQSKDVLYDDGVVVLERDGAKTKYTKYDFYEPDLGFAKLFAVSKVWNDSIAGIFAADYSIKLKSENPTWDYNKIKDVAETAGEKFMKNSDEILSNHNRPFPVALAPTPVMKIDSERSAREPSSEKNVAKK